MNHPPTTPLDEHPPLPDPLPASGERAIEGNKLEIDFESTGRKRVMDSFVTVGI